jgi:hypothetical protein
VVARGRKRLLEPDGDRGGDRRRSDDVRELGPIVDRGVLREERGNALGLVLVEVSAVGVDQPLDCCAIDELPNERGVVHLSKTNL